jgi:hypothetical protein
MRRQKQVQHKHPWRTQCSYRHHGTDKRRTNMILGSIVRWQILSSHYQHISQLLQQSVKKRVSWENERDWGNLIMNKQRYGDGKDVLNAVVRDTWEEWVSMADWLPDILTDTLVHWLTDTLTHILSDSLSDWLTTECLSEWLSNWQIDWLTNLPTNRLTYWLADWLTCWHTT